MVDVLKVTSPETVLAGEQDWARDWRHRRAGRPGRSWKPLRGPQTPPDSVSLNILNTEGTGVIHTWSPIWCVHGYNLTSQEVLLQGSI